MITAEMLQEQFEAQYKFVPEGVKYWWEYCKWLEKRVMSVEDKYGDCGGCVYNKYNYCTLESGNNCIRQAEDYYCKEKDLDKQKAQGEWDSF